MMITELYNLAFNFVRNKYIFAAIIFVLFILISKAVIFLIEKILMKLALKTETLVDDLILKVINGPISAVLILIGILISTKIMGFVNNILTGIIDSIIILIIAIVLIKISKIIIDNWGMGLAKKTKSIVDDQVIKLANNVLIVIIWAFASIFILQKWGVQIGPLLASLGIAGVAVAFALQNTLGNIFGGISMIIDKTIKVGDVVEIDGGTSGTVLDVGIRSTKIRTWNNEVIITPSGKLAESKIINYVQPNNKVRVVIPFTVEYGSDIKKVKNIVMKEILKIENFIDKPEPTVKFLAMGDSALEFKAYFYVKSYENRFAAIDDANTRIYNALNKNKIGIPFPQMDVHMEKGK